MLYPVELPDRISSIAVAPIHREEHLGYCLVSLVISLRFRQRYVPSLTRYLEYGHALEYRTTCQGQTLPLFSHSHPGRRVGKIQQNRHAGTPPLLLNIRIKRAVGVYRLQGVDHQGLGHLVDLQLFEVKHVKLRYRPHNRSGSARREGLFESLREPAAPDGLSQNPSASIFC